MRTNIEIDDKLIKEAMSLTCIKTKKEVVDYSLKNLIRSFKKKNILKYRGKMEWEGDLNKMREI